MSDGRSFPLPDAFGAEVVIYLTPWCPYCVMARRLLDRRGVAFEAFDVSANSEAREWLRANTGQRTVPQIFIKGRSIGGFDELSALERSGGLDEALA